MNLDKKSKFFSLTIKQKIEDKPTLQEELKKYERQHDCAYCGETRPEWFKQHDFVCFNCLIEPKKYGY